MAKQSAFLRDMQIKAEVEAIRRERKAGFIGRQQTLDKVAITLGMMGFTPDQFKEFGETFNEVEMDYCMEVIEDGDVDRTMTYSKEKIDRVLQQYVPEDLFQTYDERYDMSELKK